MHMLGDLIDTECICLCIGAGWKWRCHGGRLVGRVGDSHVVGSWPGLDSQWGAGRYGGILWYWWWEKPVSDVVDQDRERRLERKIAIVQIESEDSQALVGVFTGDEERCFSCVKNGLHPQCRMELMAGMDD